MTPLVVALAVLAGVATVVAGGADDSPGLQAIGVALAVVPVVLLVRGARRRRAAAEAADPRGRPGGARRRRLSTGRRAGRSAS